MAEFQAYLHQELSSLTKVPPETAEGIYRMLSQLAHHDLPTAIHSMRVARYMAVMSLLAERTLLEIESDFMCGLMHDAGKKDIPAEVLTKPGRLTEGERILIFQHVSADCPTLVEVGDLMVKDTSTIWFNVWQAMAYHHSNPAGTGYGPQGAQEKGRKYQIPDVAVATHFCDVWDASNTRNDRNEQSAPIVSPWESRQCLDDKLQSVRAGFREEGFSDEQTAGLVSVAEMAVWRDSTINATTIMQVIQAQVGFQDNVDRLIVRRLLGGSI